jgi:hypothetical protein
MLEIKVDYSERLVDVLLGPVPSQLREWVTAMEKEDRLKDAIIELRAQRGCYVQKIDELDRAIKVLEAVASSNGTSDGAMVVHNMEFAEAGIAEAAVVMIRRAGRRLHVREIVKGLLAGGYNFKSNNPNNSVGPVLFLADRQKKHGVVSKGGNTYSIREVEDREAERRKRN